MRSTHVPDDVRQLVRDAIRTVADLDVLLLARTVADRSWDAQAVGNALRTTPDAAHERLVHLERKGLIRRDADGFRYDPANRREHTVGALARAFAVYRTRIVSLIYE